MADAPPDMSEPWDEPSIEDRSFFEAAAYEESVPREPSASEREQGAKVKSASQSQATELIELARTRYGVVRSSDGKVYAVEHGKPGIALELRGRAGLRQDLAKRYYDTKGKAAGQAALTDMLNVLDGEAMDAEAVPVFLRFGYRPGELLVDLGSPNGAAVVVTGKGWQCVESSPVLFRRSPLISELPLPSRAGSLDGLRELLNVEEMGFQMLVGWLVASFMADTPRPILALFGQQGTAKTTAMKMLKMLVDPSPAPTMTPPKADEDWAVMAYHSPIIALDNLSHLMPWFQDALCKAVTGDGVVRRERYSDDGVSVLNFCRAIILTSIDPGSLQGDVADRLLTVELEPIPASARRTDAEVTKDFERFRPAVLGALLDLLSRVMAELPFVELSELPRMADFARVLAAVDKVQGWDTLGHYLSAAKDTALTVIEGDAYGTAIRDLIERRRVWTGTAGDLLVLLTPEKPGRYWPKTASKAAGNLKRMTPALKEIGIEVDAQQREGGTGRRLITLRLAGVEVCTRCGEALADALVSTGVTEHPTC